MTDSNHFAEVSKASLRRQASLIRREAHRQSAETAGRGISSAFLSTVPWRPDQVIAGYWPMTEEADVRPLLEDLARQGCPVCLPVVVVKDGPLLFRRWQPGMSLAAGRHGTFHPPEDSAPLTPELLLIPLLAFDRRGGRLGYGGGYYDRTLAALREKRSVMAVGIAYAAQEMVGLPHEPHDQRLDWIITETSAREALP
jgi:5-formyltetrahydrofolate cyclo-ligase